MRIILGSIAVVALASFTQVAAAEEAKTPKEDTKEAPAQKPAATAKNATAAPKRAAQRADVAVGAALARLDDDASLQSGALPSASALTTTPAPRSGGAPSVMTASDSGGLAGIRVARKESSDSAGNAREVTLVAVAPGTQAPRPLATVRVQRKMGVDRAMASLAPAFAACRAQAPAGTNGTIAVQLDVAPTGQVERAEMTAAKGSLGKPAAACIVAALAGATFAAPGGLGATLTVPVTVGQDRGDVTRSTISE